MATFSQMTDEVSRKLAGYTLRQDRQTHLLTTTTTVALTLTVASAVNISTGVIQIGDELIYVESYDRNTGVLTVPPYGRGYNGTTAFAHTSGSRVIISPTFPSVDIKQAINDTILAVFPSLYATASHTFTYSPVKTSYALPATAQSVLGLAYEAIGPSKEWVPIRGWRADTMANTASFGGSTNSISIYSHVHTGRTVQVFYTVAPTVMSTNADVFTTVTGLPESCRDVIVLGASARLASFVDPGRLTFGSAESDQQSQIAGRSYGAGTNTAKYLLALYEKRLAEENQKLDIRNPTRIHFTR